MPKKTPRLLLRKHSYYIRVSIPREVQTLVQYKEIRYSLQTKDYFAALIKLREESYKIDLYIDFIKRLNMEIKNNAILLSDEELNNVLSYRFRVIDDFIDNNFTKIKKNLLSFDDIALFSSKSLEKYNQKTYSADVPDEITTDPNDVRFLIKTLQDLLYQYFDWVAKQPDVSLSIKTFVEKIKKNESLFFQLTQNGESSNEATQMLLFKHLLDEVEEWGKKMVEGAKKGQPLDILPQDDPKMCRIFKNMQSRKEQNMFSTPQPRTPWEEVYENMVRPIKHSKTTSAETLKQKKKCLETIFELMDTPYIETINIDKVKDVNTLIYRVPKKWKERNPNKRLLDVLLDDNNETIDPKAMSSTNICKYLTIFQEFLRYCRQQRLINEDLADIIIKPRVNKNKNTWQPFTAKDLQIIFNPETYFKKSRNGDNAKFWIPFISLYSGARLNEICQLRVTDIEIDNEIYYFSINDEGENQSLKNQPSKRRVPIHPVLKKMGLIKQINRQKKLKKERLFDSLKFTKKNKYAGSISNAFRYYLDKKVGIIDDKKVFHSFRHTARGRFCSCGVSEEDANILCGWEGKGTGSKNYLHRDTLPIKKLYKAISKLKYPEIEENLPK